MKVLSTQPFQIVYSLFEHEYLGFLFESFIIQVNGLGKLTFQHQNISSKNAKEFASGLDSTDFELIKLMDAVQHDVVYQKFSDKKTKPLEFFTKTFDKLKGSKEKQGLIYDYIDKYMVQILPLLPDKRVFIMGSDGEPIWKEVQVAKEKASVLFHFYKNAENSHYFPTIKYQEERIDFQYKDAKIICNHPAYLLCEDKIYGFEKEVDGPKLKPFLNKRFIEVPKRMELDFYKKFGSQLVSSFDVHAKGIQIKENFSAPKALLVFTEQTMQVHATSLFSDHSDQIEDDLETSDGKMTFELHFEYGDYQYRADDKNPTQVKLDIEGETYTYHKICRRLPWERAQVVFLKSLDLDLVNAKKTMSKGDAFSWLMMHQNTLIEKGFTVKQNPNNPKQYFTGISTISLDITENIDWFDIKALVKFGDFEVPFYYLKNLILKKQREFKLPNGETAVIPEIWFAQYAELFSFLVTEDDPQSSRLKKHHISLVQELGEQNLAAVSIQRKLQNLSSFEDIDDVPLPVSFEGTLRPYQKAGYNWMHFLQKFRFGGCLADDMGLGKTIQTLAFLQSIQDEHVDKKTHLLVVPTSLMYNWELEAKKFTPKLKILIHAGSQRDRHVKKFPLYDIVITSYGTARLDEDILSDFKFHYIILDESQSIKNPGSHTSKALKQLSSSYKLILTGTPVENTTMDLWSQMDFINEGLLGSQSFFREQYLNPIEKKRDEGQAKKLNHLIKPFILRRLKSQVAKDLPEKVESIRYCNMTEAQEKKYEETKSYFRNQIMEEIDQNGLGKSQILLLQGLTKLRQIANHPLMIDPTYDGKSGKLEDVVYMLQEALSENHKILIFSQFVKHLAIFKGYLETENIPYLYLDGSTPKEERPRLVQQFQKDTETKIFLISLKSGGVGLTLTAADYVFILDPWWNPAVENQAIDRAHRIGQDKTVFTYKYITRNSVEEKILKLQDRKKQLAQDLISAEEGFVKSLSKEDIQQLLA